MLGETDTQNSSGATNPIELWMRWNETTSKAWLSTLQNSTEATANSYDSYRSWQRSSNENGSRPQEPINGNPFLMKPAEAWKTWFEATMETWRKAVDTGGDPLGLTRQWFSMMEEVQAKLLAGTPLQVDPFTLFKQWYDATGEQWSKVVEQAIGSKQFLESTRPLLESYASISITFRRANEAYFKHLQLPTTSDLANVAQLVINLEEKVDTIEDFLEDFEKVAANIATRDEVTHLAQRLDQVATVEAVTSLEQRLNQLPTTEIVSRLEQHLNQLPTNEVVSGLTQRINQLEDKLDKVLSVLEKLQENKSSADSQATSDARSRRTQKKSVSQAEAAEAQEYPDAEV